MKNALVLVIRVQVQLKKMDVDRPKHVESERMNRVAKQLMIIRIILWKTGVVCVHSVMSLFYRNNKILHSKKS